MKVKDLIEKIKDYPEFEVEAGYSHADKSKWGFTVDTYLVERVVDIGHSEKVVVLSLEKDI
jgi:hypothetical protein